MKTAEQLSVEQLVNEIKPLISADNKDINNTLDSFINYRVNLKEVFAKQLGHDFNAETTTKDDLISILIDLASRHNVDEYYDSIKCSASQLTEESINELQEKIKENFNSETVEEAETKLTQINTIIRSTIDSELNGFMTYLCDELQNPSAQTTDDQATPTNDDKISDNFNQSSYASYFSSKRMHSEENLSANKKRKIEDNESANDDVTVNTWSMTNQNNFQFFGSPTRSSSSDDEGAELKIDIPGYSSSDSDTEVVAEGQNWFPYPKN